MISWRLALAAIAAFGGASIGDGYAEEPGQAVSARLASGVERLSFLRGEWQALLLSPTREGGWAPSVM